MESSTGKPERCPACSALLPDRDPRCPACGIEFDRWWAEAVRAGRPSSAPEPGPTPTAAAALRLPLWLRRTMAAAMVGLCWLGLRAIFSSGGPKPAPAAPPAARQEAPAQAPGGPSMAGFEAAWKEYLEEAAGRGVRAFDQQRAKRSFDQGVLMASTMRPHAMASVGIRVDEIPATEDERRMYRDYRCQDASGAMTYPTYPPSKPGDPAWASCWQKKNRNYRVYDRLRGESYRYETSWVPLVWQPKSRHWSQWTEEQEAEGARLYADSHYGPAYRPRARSAGPGSPEPTQEELLFEEFEPRFIRAGLLAGADIMTRP